MWEMMFLDSVMGELHQLRGKQAKVFGQGAGVKKKRHPYVENMY